MKIFALYFSKKSRVIGNKTLVKSEIITRVSRLTSDTVTIACERGESHSQARMKQVQSLAGQIVQKFKKKASHYALLKEG